MAKQSYQAGVCNINRQEVEYRQKAAVVGLTLVTIFFLVAMLMSIHPLLRALIIIIPLFFTVINYLQARSHFCVAYAIKGMHNAEENSEYAETVDDIEARLKDRVKARRMNIQAVLISLFIALISLFVPASF